MAGKVNETVEASISFKLGYSQSESKTYLDILETRDNKEWPDGNNHGNEGMPNWDCCFRRNNNKNPNTLVIG